MHVPTVFLCVICGILVNKVNSAHILGWMANQLRLPKDQQYKSIHRPAPLPEHQPLAMEADKNLKQDNHRQPNNSPDSFAENLNSLVSNLEQTVRPVEKTDEKTNEKTNEQPAQPGAEQPIEKPVEQPTRTTPEQIEKQTNEPTDDQTDEQSDDQADEQLSINPSGLPNQSEIDQLLAAAKVERQTIQNGTQLLAEVGLLPKTKRRCKSDEDCLSSFNTMHCDIHYGFCRDMATEGELCRTDRQCNNGMICMFGKCTRPAERGLAGSRCSEDEECARDHCCAKVLGHRICKPKLKLGERCYVPHGGLDYALNELCPCSDGLLCEAVENEQSVLRKLVPKTPRVEHLRCSLG